MPTIELLKTIGAYPAIIYFGGISSMLFLTIVLVYQISSCFLAWIRKKTH